MIQRGLRILILISLMGLTLETGCSWFSKTKPEVGEYAPQIVHALPTPKPVGREIGSLWSEDSRWNDVYSPAQSRHPGDLIVVNLGAGIKNKIKQASGPKDEKKKDASKEEEKEGAAPAKESTGGGQNDSKTVDATITDVLPRGIFRIAANKGLHMGATNPYVAIRGSVREKDIASDSSVSSDSLFNVDIEVIPDEKIENKKGAPDAEGGK